MDFNSVASSRLFTHGQISWSKIIETLQIDIVSKHARLLYGVGYLQSLKSIRNSIGGMQGWVT